MEELRKKWDAYRALEFPRGCADLDPAGVCLASTDSYAAGCITTYLSQGYLDAERIKILTNCVSDLDEALRELEGDMWVYFDTLRTISREVLTI